MILLTLWQWWYWHGWQAAARALLRMLRAVLHNFSVTVLLRTLFAPWKQTVNVAGPDTPLPVRMRWWVGNQVSRFVGLAIRTGVLITAAVILLISSLAGGVLLVTWPLAPIAVLVAVIMAVTRLWV